MVNGKRDHCSSHHLPFTIHHLPLGVIYAKSETATFKSSTRQTPGTRCAASSADNALSQLSGAADATSRMPEVWLLQRPRSGAGRANLNPKIPPCEFSR